MKSASATKRLRSANASLAASENMCTASTDNGAALANPVLSSMPSICASAMPPDEGGGIEQIS